MKKIFSKVRQFGLGAFHATFMVDHDHGAAMMPGYTPAGQGKRHAAQWKAGKREAEAPRETRQIRRSRERRSRKQVAE